MIAPYEYNIIKSFINNIFTHDKVHKTCNHAVDICTHVHKK